MRPRVNKALCFIVNISVVGVIMSPYSCEICHFQVEISMHPHQKGTGDRHGFVEVELMHVDCRIGYYPILSHARVLYHQQSVGYLSSRDVMAAVFYQLNSRIPYCGFVDVCINLAVGLPCASLQGIMVVIFVIIIRTYGSGDAIYCIGLGPVCLEFLYSQWRGRIYSTATRVIVGTVGIAHKRQAQVNVCGPIVCYGLRRKGCGGGQQKTEQQLLFLHNLVSICGCRERVLLALTLQRYTFFSTYKEILCGCPQM